MNLPQAMVPTLLGLLLVLHPNSTAPAPNPFLPGVAGEAGRASSLGSEAHILATGTSEADILHTGALSSNNPKDVVDPSTLSGDGLKHSNPLVPTPEVPQVENSIKDGDSSANIIPHIPESEPNPSSLATTDGNDADTSPPMTVRWWDETYQEPPPPSYESAIRDYPPPEKESGASSPRTEPEGSSSWGSAPTGRPDGVTKPRTFLGKTGHAAWSIIKSPFTLLGWFGKQWDNLTVKLAMRTLYKKRPTYLTEEASRINKAREEQIAPLGEGLRRLKANPKSWVERMQNAQSVFKAKWKDTLLYRIWRGKKTSEPKLDPSTDKPAVSTEYSSFPEAAGESSGLTRGAENLDHSEVQPLASAELPGQPPSGTSAPEFMPEPIHPMGSSGGAGGLTSEGGSGAATSGNVPIILSGEEQTASKEVPLLANDRHPSGTSTFENLKETPKADELQSPQKGADGMKNTPGSPENTINWPENSGSRLSSLMRTLSQSFLGR